MKAGLQNCAVYKKSITNNSICVLDLFSFRLYDMPQYNKTRKKKTVTDAELKSKKQHPRERQKAWNDESAKH